MKNTIGKQSVNTIEGKKSMLKNNIPHLSFCSFKIRKGRNLKLI